MCEFPSFAFPISARVVSCGMKVRSLKLKLDSRWSSRDDGERRWSSRVNRAKFGTSPRMMLTVLVDRDHSRASHDIARRSRPRRMQCHRHPSLGQRPILATTNQHHKTPCLQTKKLKFTGSFADYSIAASPCLFVLFAFRLESLENICIIFECEAQTGAVESERSERSMLRVRNAKLSASPTARGCTWWSTSRRESSARFCGSRFLLNAQKISSTSTFHSISSLKFYGPYLHFAFSLSRSPILCSRANGVNFHG